MAAGGRDDVQVKFGADTKGVEDGAKRTASVIADLTRQVRGFTDSFKALGAGLLTGFSVAGLVKFTQDMADWGDQLQDTAMQLGATTERVSELAYIANASGDSLDSVALGMQRLGRNAAEAASGSQNQADAFNRLGVSVVDAEGKLKSMDQLLLETADSFARHADGPEKVALAMELFGRAGVNMIPILNEGRAGFERLEQVARRTGTVLSAETVAGMVAVQQSAIELKVSFQGLGVALFNVFQPAINGLIKSISGLVQTMTGWVNESYETGGAMRFVALMAAAVTSAIMTMVSAFELLWEVASAVLNSIGQSLGNTARAIGYALQGNFAEAGKAIQDGAGAIVKTWQDAGGKIGGILTSYSENIKEMWNAILNPPAFQVPGTGDNSSGGGLSSFAAPTNFQAQQEQLSKLRSTLTEINGMFKSTFSSIIGGFDKAISGLITGTMSWRDAMLTVVDSLWSTFVGFIEDWVAEWLAAQATMLIASQTKDAAVVASSMAAENAASGNMIIEAIKAIFVSSKQTAAGVTANLAPTMGPLALPAGLAAGAAVAGLASFDKGSWELDRDQVAQVHKGEMIVPAQGGVADQMRSMLSGMGNGGGGKGGGGGPSFDFRNAVILDKAGLAKMVVDTLNKNPSMRGSY